MKKVTLSLLILATAVTMMACGGKSANNAGETTIDNAKQTEQATVEEVSAPQEVKIEDQTELECDAYIIKVPDGWKARSRMVNSSCVMGLKQPPFTTASPNVVSYMTLDQYKAKREGEGSKAIDNITVNGHEFVVYENEGADEQLFLGAATALDKGTLQVTLQTGAHKLTKDEAKAAINANMKTILENISIK